MSAFQAIPATDRKTEMYALKSGETFIKGAFVILTAGEILEASADPATVRGIAAHDADGRDILTDEILVHEAREGATFWMEGESDFVAGDQGTQYGVVKDADGVWVVDRTDTLNLVVEVLRVDLDKQIAEVEILDSVADIGA